MSRVRAGCACALAYSVPAAPGSSDPVVAEDALRVAGAGRDVERDAVAGPQAEAADGARTYRDVLVKRVMWSNGITPVHAGQLPRAAEAGKEAADQAHS